VNPFILLLKPMIAVGTYVTKLIVAGGMVVANNMQGDQPPSAQAINAEAAIVRLVVSPEDGSLSQMEVQLPNGEFYQLANVGFEEVSEPERPAPSRMVGRASSRSAHPAPSSSGNTVAMLESETGHTMRCNVSLPSDSNDGSGVCMKDTGEKYEFSL
jgi:hypothetical protein